MIKGNYRPVLLLTLITVTSLSMINGVFAHIFQNSAAALFMLQFAYTIAYFFISPFAGITTVFVYRRLRSDPERFEPTALAEARDKRCGRCGAEILENFQFCAGCGTPVNREKPKGKFYTAGFVLGILSFLPMCGIGIGLIGFPLACISKRKSSIILNGLGIITTIVMTFIIGFIAPACG